jgi:hypothetical protein
MNDRTDLDQVDEEILAYDVSDDALEAAAGPRGTRGSLGGGECCFSFLGPQRQA